MPLPKYIGAYEDVQRILDEIVRVGEDCTFTLQTAKGAVAWRQRANMFRKVYRNTIADPSPYDHLILRLGKGERVVRIEHGQKTTGKLETAEGERLAADAPVDVVKPAKTDGPTEFAENVALARLVAEGEDEEEDE